jgi:Domain of unknown function (DUF4440)
MNRDDIMAELRALNARFIHNFITNDVASHDAILHRDFVSISSNGRRMDRGSYLTRWANLFDPEVIPYWDTRDELITVIGEVALLRATNKFIEVSDGRETTGMTCYTDTYVRENGTWLCIQAQLTDVQPAFWPDDSTIVSVYVKGRRVS